MQTRLLNITPVLPSADIARDLKWHEAHTGFQCVHSDGMYAVLRRDNLWVHLQWHAGTAADPLLGGSVIKIFVQNIQPIFEELVKKRTVSRGKLRLDTPWGTHEFGFYDLNKNAIFFVENAR